jgi:predicted Rossmann fold flavoprotein
MSLAANCIVIGAGPAGLAAAIAAAGGGESVLVLEKKDRAGKKLLLTGGGRCNVWDPARAALEALEGFGKSGLFLRQALAAFDLSDFLRVLGVEVEPDRDALFVCGGAERMRNALVAEIESRGVEFRPRCQIRYVGRAESGFAISVGEEVLECRRLILATGGITYPGTGSSGDGYVWARSLGHEIETPTPALGGLLTEPCFPKLAGISLERTELSFPTGKKRRCARGGALLFTHDGLSGPAAFDIGLELARIGSGEEAQLRLDLVPMLSPEELTAALIARARSETKRSIGTAGLGELLPVRLLSHLAELAGIKPERRMGSISHKEHLKLAAVIKGVALRVVSPCSARGAMVTVGGVDPGEVDPRSMESRLVAGLFFAGEILAPAGRCGGYNLLMAFATGTMAGCSGRDT